MAVETKKRVRKAPAKAAVEVPVAGEAASVPMRVSLNDLWAMRLAKAEQKTAEVEKKLAQAQAESARMARLYALAKLDPKGIILGIEKQRDQAQTAEKAAEKAIEAAENRSLLAIKRMEAALGRPMRGLAIDPDTGEVADKS